ncbi:hypothetical protein CHS0354_016964 [Potamilus streckersoni]|uniref:Ig-like domain-containing protein n=1 Tax=Potamilus streckersoni TaxID=2493646 RepID=A0AAE0S7L2_9BIVA|nr:hypothetical protein CHS0354_016964 [Potamilus streckersoni]
MRYSKLCLGVLMLLLIANCETKNEASELNGVSPKVEDIPPDDVYDYDNYPGDTNQTATDSNIGSGDHTTPFSDNENDNTQVWDSIADKTGLKATIIGSNENKQKVVLVCNAESVPAEVTFLPWVHMWGSMVIRDNLHGRIDDYINELIIDNVSLQDKGTYICFGKSSIKGAKETKILTESVNLNLTENKGRLSAEIGIMVAGVSALLIVGIVVIITVFLIKGSSQGKYRKQGKQSREESQPGTETTTVNIVYILAGEVTGEHEYLQPKTTDERLCSEINVKQSGEDVKRGCKDVVLEKNVVEK